MSLLRRIGETFRSLALSGVNAPALAAIVAALLGAASAEAQTQTSSSSLINTPAEKFVTAPGGVDMRTGRYVYSQTDLSIGGGSGALSLNRILTADVPGHVNPFANPSHNWDVMISEERIDIDNPDVGSGTDYRMSVHFGGRSQTYQSYSYETGFRQMSSGGHAPLTFTGDRATTSALSTYTAVDGSVTTFRSIGNGDCSSTRRCAYVSRIDEPDGTRFSFSYVASGSATGGSVRLQQISSSQGFALLLESSGNIVSKACVLNLASAPAPTNGLCPAGVPTASYGYSAASGTTRLTSFTGPDDTTGGFTYTPLDTNRTAMGFVKPGQSTPWLTNTFHTEMDEQEVAQEKKRAKEF